MSMRAAVLREPGTPLTVEDVELAPPRSGEITVRMEASGVCHSDYHYMTGDITCPLPVVIPVNNLVQRQKRVIGSLYGSANPLVDLPKIFGLFPAGRLPLDQLIGVSYRLDQVNEAYAALAHGSPGRAVVVR